MSREEGKPDLHLELCDDVSRTGGGWARAGDVRGPGGQIGQGGGPSDLWRSGGSWERGGGDHNFFGNGRTGWGGRRVGNPLHRWREGDGGLGRGSGQGRAHQI